MWAIELLQLFAASAHSQPSPFSVSKPLLSPNLMTTTTANVLLILTVHAVLNYKHKKLQTLVKVARWRSTLLHQRPVFDPDYMCCLFRVCMFSP